MREHPPIFIDLPYRSDVLLEQFAPLAQQPWAMLLHSGHAEHPHNRFDILVADPCITLVTHGEITEICASQQTCTSQEEPFTLLQQQLDILALPAVPREDLPFQGGALGLFGYHLGQHQTPLSHQAQPDNDLPDMAVGLYDWALIADHQLHRLTLVCHGDPEARLGWLAQQRVEAMSPFQLTSAWQANMTRQEYGTRFRRVQHYLRSGDCYQVNLAQRFRADYRGDEWQAFLALNQSNRAPFSAFIRLPSHCVLSMSPERFLWLQGRQIQTRPIKGTLPRLTEPEADRQQALRLAASEKDRAENLMIVDLLRNDIGRVAQPGSVKVPELFVVEPFPAVHHLVSTITALLRDGYHASDLLRACFPGGSITGAPKIRAMQIIDELEPQRRHAYCGSIGYLSACGTMDTNITIRTPYTANGRIYCSAGGGIVADSEEQAEYQETFDKVSRILAPLAAEVSP